MDKNNSHNSFNTFEKIKSKYILKQIFDNLKFNKLLRVIHYNKTLKNALNIKLKDYINEHSKIIIEIIPDNFVFGTFINIKNEEESYYHIYINDDDNQIKKYTINRKDKISKIKIVIDYKVKSLSQLFFNCKCIKSINFIKFNKKDINNMSYMFYNCSFLEEINLSNFNTNKVKNMSYMFSRCSSLRQLNAYKFNTDNVETMFRMFSECSLLNDLNLSNFNTDNVKNMSWMFFDCKSLKELNLSNFNTNNVSDMSRMFADCSLLKKLNLSNFKTNKLRNATHMFFGCSSLEELDISKFNIDNVKFMFCMFWKRSPSKLICPEKIKNIILHY